MLLLSSASKLAGSLHPLTAKSVSVLLELMNSYYSNMIEGNPTKPYEIERALSDKYDKEVRKREWQIETRAHVEVQREFENKVRNNPDIEICTKEFICDIHRRLYELIPEASRWIDNEKGKKIEVIPGKLRTHEVKVAEHVAPRANSLNDFLDRFHEAYEPARLSSIEKIIAAAASHHRLAWIHPFQDGNGRVARLFTHLYLIRANIDGNGLWTLSRGLARRRQEYYTALANADTGRLSNYDGRGNLSLQGLNQFTTFLLDIAIDQVHYMSELLAIDTIHARLREYAQLLALQKEVDETAEHLLLEVYLRGELPRGEVKRITGLPERSARRVSDALNRRNLIVSESKHRPWRLNFPTEAAKYIFPSLY